MTPNTQCRCVDVAFTVDAPTASATAAVVIVSLAIAVSVIDALLISGSHCC